MSRLWKGRGAKAASSQKPWALALRRFGRVPESPARLNGGVLKEANGLAMGCIQVIGHLEKLGGLELVSLTTFASQLSSARSQKLAQGRGLVCDLVRE